MKVQFSKICLILISLFAITSPSFSQGSLNDIDTTLDSIFGHYNLGQKPGLSIAILEQEKPVFLKSYGHANLEYAIRNKSNTLFNATDLAKKVTIFSILLLEDRGLLQVEDEVGKHLPNFPNFSESITLKHLMDQTSGLRDVMDLMTWKGYTNGDVITKQDILEVVSREKDLNFAPGSQFDYNRTGFVLLTEVVAKLSGKTFAQFVDENIFTPLAMDNSVFVSSHTELLENRSYSYRASGDEYLKVPNNSTFLGGSNLFTSAEDYARWLGNMSEPIIGKPAFYDYLHTHLLFTDGSRSKYTAGIFKESSEGYERIHLEGFDHGYTGYRMHIPKYDFSLVYFSNDIDFPIDEINPMLWGWFNKDYQVAPLEASPIEEVKSIPKRREDLKKYTGLYLLKDYYDVREIVLDRDSLYYDRGGNNRNSLIPIAGQDLFKMQYSGNENMRVSFGKNGVDMEFREKSTSGEPDYVVEARRITYDVTMDQGIGGEFTDTTLDHTISIEVTSDIQLHINNIAVQLLGIGNDEYLCPGNSKYQLLKVQRDTDANVLGIYLSGGSIKNLFYQRVDKKF